MSLLEVKDLQVYYGMIHAIKGVSFHVEEGEIIALIGANGAGKTTILHTVSFDLKSGRSIAIVGPSGSGKSTLLNLIPRLYDVTGGQVLFDGRDVTKTPPHKIVSLGMAQVPEGRRVFSQMTVYQNLKMGA